MFDYYRKGCRAPATQRIGIGAAVPKGGFYAFVKRHPILVAAGSFGLVLLLLHLGKRTGLETEWLAPLKPEHPIVSSKYRWSHKAKRWVDSRGKFVKV